MIDHLQNIIKRLKSICKEELPEINQDTILEQAVDIYLSKQISESNKEIQSMKNSKPIEKPTEAQVYFIKKAGKEVPKTKQEAFELIKKIKQR